MRRYEVILERVMVPYHQRELACLIAMQVLDARLGGPAGVVDAFNAAGAVTGGDPRWSVPESASRADVAAVKRWRRATEAALDAIEQGFAHVFVGMSAQEIALARADECLSIVPHAMEAPARLLSEARVGLPWSATAAVRVSAAAQAAIVPPVAMLTHMPTLAHAAMLAR